MAGPFPDLESRIRCAAGCPARGDPCSVCACTVSVPGSRGRKRAGALAAGSSPVVTGYVLLLGFGRKGPIGSFLAETFGISFAFNWMGAALAAGVMAFPLLVRPIRLSFEAVDPKLEEAAKSLGAHRVIAFLTVTLPLTLPGILGGAILGFAKAMGEFGATITFVSNIPGETRTLALALYSATQSPSGDIAAFRLTIIAAIVAFAALIASEFLARHLRKRLGGNHD